MQLVASEPQYSTTVPLREKRQKPEPEDVIIRQPFAGVSLYCWRCRKLRFAPWAPAMCPRCGTVLRIAECQEVDGRPFY